MGGAPIVAVGVGVALATGGAWVGEGIIVAVGGSEVDVAVATGKGVTEAVAVALGGTGVVEDVGVGGSSVWVGIGVLLGVTVTVLVLTGDGVMEGKTKFVGVGASVPTKGSVTSGSGVAVDVGVGEINWGCAAPGTVANAARPKQ